MNKEQQQQKALRFHRLHQEGLLVLPNIWDALGAALVEDAGYPAVATASAAVSLTHGYNDGEAVPFSELLSTVRAIVRCTSLPVTVDAESGYAQTLNNLKENIHALLRTGAVGINIEDYHHKQQRLYTTEEQCGRIRQIINAANEYGVSLFINARTDVYLKGKGANEETRLQEVISRVQAYRQAGAHCLFLPGMVREQDLKRVVHILNCPVNVLALPGLPGLERLQAIGVRRLSLGPGLLRFAAAAAKGLLQGLAAGNGLQSITGNELTTAYLSDLISKHA